MRMLGNNYTGKYCNIQYIVERVWHPVSHLHPWCSAGMPEHALSQGSKPDFGFSSFGVFARAGQDLASTYATYLTAYGA